ncbi:class I SAM-dependent methyltransferase [Pelagibius litoralis]|uniref:S-adenosyl-L-methionine-dependent methyltransferase n=1 Tax=Pelagibius litoralis TaxID=374515 RepID=A0A967KBV8_9PROT|nr:class I SAM-dependent methyltransferase [Pelagibius litoralis]NIA72373.1 class I SAM-dependent methyltransferase [Pelagibius litoralis]
MKPNEFSRSALIVSLMRAVHSQSDQEPIINDQFGMALVSGEERAALGALLFGQINKAASMNGLPEGPAKLVNVMRAYPGYGNVILRTRYSEDRLADAMKGGIAQYVIVGAGMDSFAFRRLDLKHTLRIIEIDHPATQAMKLERLAAANLHLSENVCHIPADLEQTTVQESLHGSPFDPQQPAFFSWLGVSPYLTWQANTAAIRSIAQSAAPMSELVFNYVSPQMGQLSVPAPEQKRPRTNEPILSRPKPGAIRMELEGAGFEIIEDVGSAEIIERYCAGRSDGLAPTNSFRIVHARKASLQGTVLT